MIITAQNNLQLAPFLQSFSIPTIVYMYLIYRIVNVIRKEIWFNCKYNYLYNTLFIYIYLFIRYYLYYYFIRYYLYYLFIYLYIR